MNICVLTVIAHVRYEVFTTVLLKILVLYNVMLYQMVNGYVCFEGL
jgi:hypothetical protein